MKSNKREGGGRLEAFFPPGYDRNFEIGSDLTILILLLVTFSQVLMSYSNYYKEGMAGWITWKTPFFEIINYGLRLWLPYMMFCVYDAVCHYRFFYKDTKSIYLMKRICDGWELHRRCLVAPAVMLTAGTLLFIILIVIFAH